MMSSEEESECVAKQQEPLLVLKKSKRMRQRVDAGEPRNSYASIPNFSSRPQVTSGYLNNGYSVSDHALTSPYGNEDIADNNSVLIGTPGINSGNNNSSSSSNSNGVVVVNNSVAGFLLQGRGGDQPAFRASTAAPRMLLQPKVEKFEKMCSADVGVDGGQQQQQQQQGEVVAIKQEVDDHSSNSSVGSSSSSSSLCNNNNNNNNVDENSQLLREILQGGGAAAAAVSGKAVKNALRSMQKQHRGDANGMLQSAVNGGKSNGGSLISHLLRSGNGGVGVEDAAASCRSGTLVQLLLSSDESEGTDAVGTTSPSGRRPSDTATATVIAMNDVGDLDPDAVATVDERGRRGSSSSTAPEDDDGASVEDDDASPEKMRDEQQQQPAAAALSPAAGVTPTTPSTAAVASSPSMPQASGGGAAATSSTLAAATDADLKRARVENIISTMRSSPFRPSTGETQQVNGGCKKRKLYMPQQHDSKAASNGGSGRAAMLQAAASPPLRGGDFGMEYDEDEDDGTEPVAAKQRRTGCQQEVLRQQLSQMQKQIAAIQMKLDSYDPQNGSDTDPMDSPRSDAGDGDVLVVGGANAGSRMGGSSAATPGRSVLRGGGAVGASPLNHGRLNANSPLQFHLGYVGGHHGRDGGNSGKPSVEHMEPAHFIDEARRLVSEQERLAKAASASMMTSTPLQAAPACSSPLSCSTEPKVAATAPSGPVSRGGLNSDWDRLADSLKMGMSSLIDDWVRRCAASKSSRHHQSHAILEGSSCKDTHQGSPTTVSASSAPTSVTSSLMPPSSSASASALISASCVPTSSASACISAFSSSAAAAAAANAVALHGLADRRSPRTKVIDRGRMGGVLAPSLGSSQGMGGGANPSVSAATAAAVHELFKYSDHQVLHHLKHSMSGLFPPPPKPPMPLYVPHPQPQPPQALAFYGGNHGQMSGVGGGESPEQSEALPLVVTHKKKRHKVTDTRITPRTVSRLLQGGGQQDDGSSKLLSLMNGRGSPVEGGVGSYPHPQHPHHSPMVPVSLPTSVAIPNPSLHQSDVYSPYPYYHHPAAQPHHPRGSPNSDGDTQLFHPHHPLILRQQNSPEPINYGAQMKAENGDSSDCNSADMMYDGTMPTSSTLTPMHLRKAKLMFFYVRYPSSAILKTYFPDIKFNKNNTAQLVKWFSNFREFYYIQMEKYARQAISEGCKVAEDLTVTTDSELYRVLNLHYNRNNHIEVPVTFRYVVEQTLREFFKAIFAGKDTEQSWKKSIYKVIARMDDNLPEYFKSPNFLEQLE